jgi:Ca-activated chloride channel homolog
MKRLVLPIVGILTSGAGSAVVLTQPAFKSGVELVQLDVAVTRGRKPVTGLGAGDFEITDNGTVQVVQSSTLSDVPLDLTMVLDISRSMSGQRLHSLVAAASQLLNLLQRDDRIALIAFTHRVSRVVEIGRDLDAVRRSLEGFRGDGSSSVRDAIYLSLQNSPRRGARPMVLVFTDGLDTSSWLTEREVLTAAERAGSVVHILTTEPGEFFERVAEASGGRTWTVNADGQLPKWFAEALTEMRSRYLLSYSPSGASTPGWHTLRVRVKNRSVDINARRGYFVAPP